MQTTNTFAYPFVAVAGKPKEPTAPSLQELRNAIMSAYYSRVSKQANFQENAPAVQAIHAKEPSAYTPQERKLVRSLLSNYASIMDEEAGKKLIKHFEL